MATSADLPDDFTGLLVRLRTGLSSYVTGRCESDRGKQLDVRLNGGDLWAGVKRSRVEAVLPDPRPYDGPGLDRRPDYEMQREGYARSCAIKGERQAVVKPQRTGGVNERYRKWVRTLPCAWCGAAPPSEADHHPHRGHGGGRRDDLRVVPLCTVDHAHRTNTRQLGAMTPEDTERWMERRQIELLTAWIRGEAA